MAKLKDINLEISSGISLGAPKGGRLFNTLDVWYEVDNEQGRGHIFQRNGSLDTTLSTKISLLALFKCINEATYKHYDDAIQKIISILEADAEYTLKE